MLEMTSNRPYLLRALYEWILENDMTPHLVVDTTVPGTRVPVEHIEDDQIVLNVLPDAVRNLQMANDSVSFSARFNGRAQQVYVPMQSVLAIYARENGKGLIFPDEPESEDEGPANTGENRGKQGKPHLKVIK